MPTIPYLGLISLLLILVTAARWFWRAWRVNVPANFAVFRGAWVLSSGLGLLALCQSPDAFAAWATGLGLLLVYLVSTGAQRVGEVSIKVGDMIPAFIVTDEQGELFDSNSLAGKRVLLKFFRGHW